SFVDHVLIEAVAAGKAGQRHNLCNAHLFLLVEFPGPLEFSGIKVEGGPASSSHSFFQYGSGSIVWKPMEMATTQTLFCRMDYQNGSVWRNEQDEAGRSCGNEQKRSIWKTVVSHTQQERVPSSLQMEVKAAL